MSITRLISAIVALIIALSILFLGSWYFAIGLCVAVYFGQQEYFQLVLAKGIKPAVQTTLIVSQIFLILSALAPEIADAVFPLAGIAVCFYMLFAPYVVSIADLATSILGLFYGAYLPSYWIRLRVNLAPAWAGHFQPESWPNWQQLSPALTHTLLAFMCIWAADIGAYVFGKNIGKTKLSAISPKKTVEGAICGFLGSIAVGIGGAYYLQWPYWGGSGLLFGLVIGGASLAGDLTESVMKRDAGVKDSGDLIPGHGGILDRTDSYIFTGPLVYYFFKLILPLMA
jgi:phosphatidate cytidylyltransferase